MDARQAQAIREMGVGIEIVSLDAPHGGRFDRSPETPISLGGEFSRDRVGALEIGQPPETGSQLSLLSRPTM